MTTPGRAIASAAAAAAALLLPPPPRPPPGSSRLYCRSMLIDSAWRRCAFDMFSSSACSLTK
jgi:hypothetical protein